MSSEYRCPNCGVTDTRYRSTARSHICNRCGHKWGGDTKDKSGWFSQLIEWAKAHPFGALLTLSVALTVAGILAVSDPGASAGDRAAIWVIAVVLWMTTYGYWKYRKSRELHQVDVDDKTVDESPPFLLNNSVKEPLMCSKCGNALEDDANFCERCGTQI